LLTLNILFLINNLHPDSKKAIKPRPYEGIEEHNEDDELDFFEKTARIDLPWKDVVTEYETLFELLKMGGEPKIKERDLLSSLKMLSIMKNNKDYLIDKIEAWEKKLEKYLSKINDDKSEDNDSVDEDEDEDHGNNFDSNSSGSENNNNSSGSSKNNNNRKNNSNNSSSNSNNKSDNPRGELKSHYYTRQNARHNLHIYTDKMKDFMLNKNKDNKRKREFSVGDLVRILIPKIDRQSLDRKYLLCKITNKYDNEIYQLACKSGIINVAYPSAELELLENQDIPELHFTPTRKISIREAARLQNIIIENDDNNEISYRVCNCKKNNCCTRVCPCKKHNAVCTSRCHKGSVCLNKNI